MKRIAIIGAGWAGLAAAVEATQAGHAVTAGYLDPKRLAWGALACRPQSKPERVADLDTVARAIEVFRSSPEFIAPASLVAEVKKILDGGASDLLR